MSERTSVNSQMKNQENIGNLRSFGRRKGRRLRPHVQKLVDILLPEISVDGVIDINSMLVKTADKEKNKQAQHYQQNQHYKQLYLEIGFGGGEHLAHIAAIYPDILMLGCEPYLNGVGSLLKEIEKNNLRNIRIYNQDARDLLAALPDNCLDQAYILYPDPWPKARHYKRRLIQKPLLAALARTMKPGAKLHIATDWDDYCTWILERILADGNFNWLAESSADWNQPWPQWLPTRYEKKARREGRCSSYLTFQRVFDIGD